MRASLSSSSSSSRYTSMKWIQNLQKRDGGQELKTEDISDIFREVERKPCNLISIFGRARQGKSFLMNVLANENDIFRVSNEKESCTQGIDISNKWLSVTEFSRIDHATGIRSENQVGFVDAEGQGDKDVAYDANLVCPILLTSKCVIFNWKGDLQKDHMLNTLGIMARAAENVRIESSSGTSSKKFGHLHICFRDWQAVGSSSSDVFSQLFNEEKSQEANTRNKIRRDVKACFESIKVWLFDAPVERSDMLKQRLKLEMCTENFRNQVRLMRNELSIQLSQPTMLGGRPLTGSTMANYVREITSCLNQGRVVLPQNAYSSMIKQEVDNLYRHALENLNTDIDKYFSNISKLAISRDSSFPNEGEAMQKFNGFFSFFQEQLDSELKLLIGDVPSAMSREITKDIPHSLQLMETLKTRTGQQFSSKYKSELRVFFAAFRKEGEEILRCIVETLKSDISSVSSCENSVQIQEIFWSQIQKYSEGLQRKWNKSAEWNETMQSWQNFIELGSEAIWPIIQQKNEKSKRAAEQAKEEARVVLEDYKEQLNRFFSIVLKELDSKFSSGFSKILAIEELNKKFKSMKRDLRTRLDRNLHCDIALADFRLHAEQRSDYFVTLYEDLREEKFTLVKSILEGEIEKLSKSISLKTLHTFLPGKTKIDYSRFDENDLSAILSNGFFQTHYYEIVQPKKKLLSGWDDFEYYWSEMEEISIIIPAQECFGRCKESILAEFNIQYEPVAVVAPPSSASSRVPNKSPKPLPVPSSSSSSSAVAGIANNAKAPSKAPSKAPARRPPPATTQASSATSSLALAAEKAREFMKRVHGIDHSSSSSSSSASAKRAKVGNEALVYKKEEPTIKINPHIEFLAREHEKAKIAMRKKGYKILYEDDEDDSMQVEGAKSSTKKRNSSTTGKTGGGSC